MSHANRHTRTQTLRHTDTDTDTHTHIQTHTCAHAYTNKRWTSKSSKNDCQRRESVAAPLQYAKESLVPHGDASPALVVAN